MRGCCTAHTPQPLIWLARRLMSSSVLVGTLPRAIAKGKQGGVRIEVSHYSIWTLRDGKVLRIDQVETKAEALEAVGLPE